MLESIGKYEFRKKDGIHVLQDFCAEEGVFGKNA